MKTETPHRASTHQRAPATAHERHNVAAARLAEETAKRPAPAEAPPDHSAPSPMTAGLEGHDRRTHVERINPGPNPAHVPGLAMGPAPDGRKPYRVLRSAKHADTILPAGTIVMLLPEEVEDHHEPVK